MTIDTLWSALILVLVIEGLLYAVAPRGMQRLIVTVLDMPPGTLRLAGLMAAGAGVAVLWVLHAA